MNLYEAFLAGQVRAGMMASLNDGSRQKFNRSDLVCIPITAVSEKNVTVISHRQEEFALKPLTGGCGWGMKDFNLHA